MRGVRTAAQSVGYTSRDIVEPFHQRYDHNSEHAEQVELIAHLLVDLDLVRRFHCKKFSSAKAYNAYAIGLASGVKSRVEGVNVAGLLLSADHNDYVLQDLR